MGYRNHAKKEELEIVTKVKSILSEELQAKINAPKWREQWHEVILIFASPTGNHEHSLSYFKSLKSIQQTISELRNAIHLAMRPTISFLEENGYVKCDETRPGTYEELNIPHKYFEICWLAGCITLWADKDILYFFDRKHAEYEILFIDESRYFYTEKLSILETLKERFSKSVKISFKWAKENLSDSKRSYENEKNWHLQKVGFDEFLPARNGIKITCAIIDTNFTLTHKEFSRSFSNEKIRRFISYRPNRVFPPMGMDTHGDRCVSLIAGKDNGLVSKNTKILPITQNNREMSFFKAAQYAVENGARVICISQNITLEPLEKYSEDVKLSVFRRLLDRIDALGCVVVCSAGNDGHNSNSLDILAKIPPPFIGNRIDRYLSRANTSAAIAVGAITRDNKVWPDSGNGKVTWNFHVAGLGRYTDYPRTNPLIKPDIFAPGVDIQVLYGDDKHSFDSGTSFATPIVAGAVCILMSQFAKEDKKFPSDILLKSLLEGASDIGEDAPSLCLPGAINRFLELTTEGESNGTI